MQTPSVMERMSTYKDVGALVLKYFPKISHERDHIARGLGVEHEVEPSEDAEAFASDLEKLGPTFVKIGQLLSTRSDLLPPAWLTALQRLQDDVAPVPVEGIRKKIEDELGAKIDRLFDEFDDEPLASASLGQVHRARLRSDGPEVVVKVQRPDIREKVASELRVVQEIADFLREHTKVGKDYDIDRMVGQFRKSILNELNYQSEAENLVRLGRVLSEFDHLFVPSPIRDYCSPGVLTMDYIAGSKVTELSGVVMTEIDGELLAEQLFHGYLKQVLVDGFFHADPHPGNIVMTRDRRLALIDLGMVGSLSETMRDHMLRLLGAVSDAKAGEATKVALAMGTPKENFDSETFSTEMAEMVEARQATRVADLEVGALVMRVTEIAGKNGLRIPQSLFMVGKVLLNLDQIGKTLAPDFNPDACVQRHLSELANQRFRQELSLGNIIHHLSDLKELFSETPARLNKTLELIANNKLSLDVNAIDEEALLMGFHRVANRITVGIILAALIVGASMMMRIESSFMMFGYPGLAMIFFLIAAVGGLIMVGRILFGSER